LQRNEVLEMLREVINELNELNGCPRRPLSESDTPFDGTQGLDSLNALEAEAELAGKLNLPPKTKKLAAIRNPKLSMGEAARRIAAELGL
jgi:hypothetical protein